MRTGDTQMDKDIRKIQKTCEDIKGSLIDKILALPDNPRINRIAGAVKCFTMKSSDLGACWSPEYHNFKVQHEYLALIVNKKEIFDVTPTLRKIIKTGQYRNATETIKFHPDVIKQLEGIMK